MNYNRHKIFKKINIYYIYIKNNLIFYAQYNYLVKKVHFQPLVPIALLCALVGFKILKEKNARPKRGSSKNILLGLTFKFLL